MQVPDDFKPQLVERQELPDENNYILNSRDRTSGEIYNANYNINIDHSDEVIVMFDNIKFKNSQYGLEKDIDYIGCYENILSDEPTYYRVANNLNFTQPIELANYIQTLVESFLTISYDSSNTYTVVLEFSDINNCDYVISYKLARMLGVWSFGEIINSDGDIRINFDNNQIYQPCKAFIEDYKWTINFGRPICNAITGENNSIIADGNFGYPNNIMSISGNRMADTMKAGWNIKFIDDMGHYHKLLTDYEIKFRVIHVIPAHMVTPEIPQELRYLFAKNIMPTRLTTSVRASIKSKYPCLLPKATALDSLAQMHERIDEYSQIKYHPDRKAQANKRDAIVSDISESCEVITHVMETEGFTSLDDDGRTDISSVVSDILRDKKVNSQFADYSNDDMITAAGKIIDTMDMKKFKKAAEINLATHFKKQSKNSKSQHKEPFEKGADKVAKKIIDLSQFNLWSDINSSSDKSFPNIKQTKDGEFVSSDKEELQLIEYNTHGKAIFNYNFDKNFPVGYSPTAYRPELKLNEKDRQELNDYIINKAGTCCITPIYLVKIYMSDIFENIHSQVADDLSYKINPVTGKPYELELTNYRDFIDDMDTEGKFKTYINMFIDPKYETDDEDEFDMPTDEDEFDMPTDEDEFDMPTDEESDEPLNVEDYI